MPSRRFFILLGLAAFLLAFPLSWAVMSSLTSGPLVVKKDVVIQKGMGSHQISLLLGHEQVISFPLLFVLTARLTGKEGHLLAGEYTFAPHVSLWKVLDKLRRHEVKKRFLTLPEGLTSWEVVQLLKEAPGLQGEVSVPPEGSLLLDTYEYTYGDQRQDLIKRMQVAMKAFKEASWPKRDKGLPLASWKEAVTLASLVEQETGRSEERPLIASVFINRLHRSMRLQSDVTLLYALTEGRGGRLGRHLVHKDTKVDSPYNTYTIKGLPPSPINNPSRLSLQAVLHPANTSFLYFVANGQGGHFFSKSFTQHKRNIVASSSGKGRS